MRRLPDLNCNFSELVQGLVDYTSHQSHSRNVKLMDVINSDYPSLYIRIINHTDFIPGDVHHNSRLWCIINKIYERPTCKLPTCENFVKFKGLGSGFMLFCCSKCSQVHSKGRIPSSEAIIKRKRTLMTRYGADHNFKKSSSLYDNKQETIERKYGCSNVSQSSTVQHIKQQNILDRYKGMHFAATPEFKERKYGRIDGCLSHQKISQHALDCITDADWLRQHHHTYKKTMTQIASELNVSIFCISSRLDKFGIEKRRFSGSNLERDVLSYLEELDLDVRFRYKVDGVEVDLYLPNLGVAFEVDGLYWHSDHHDRISRNYHLHKTVHCSNRNVELYHIFENEWHAGDFWKDRILKLVRQEPVISPTGKLVKIDRRLEDYKRYLRFGWTVKQIIPPQSLYWSPWQRNVTLYNSAIEVKQNFDVNSVPPVYTIWDCGSVILG